ncbi:MAG: MMPL family transporter [Ilumatobacter sp.]|uniref:MMPL family transporter n=1 Tax=Ilumatobacter sp. TaxID=1967498 RepID=UPI00260244CA|nr:MMPL family transporter [Ilumatobacter sp.]MDJ0767939.1 MMPL family transporter [Ilumatobacter sp.]
MSHALYRLGRLAARRPWMMIGVWLIASIAVIAASGAFGRDLEDSFAVPGLDSQEAVDLLSTASSDQAGLTAQIVTTPIDDGATFFDSAASRDALADLQADAAALPNVLGTNDPAGALADGPEAAVQTGSVSADGRVALIRVQYPVIEELSHDDLVRLKEFGADARTGSPLQIEMGGDLFFSFEEPETGIGEMIGLAAAVIILLLAFGSVIAMGLPIGMALFGLALGVSSMALITYLIDIPSWAPQMGSMIGLGVGIDYALFLVTRHREHLARGMTVVESVGRAVATAGQAVIFAGGTVVIAILGLAVAGVPFMTAAGVATSVIVLLMVIASVTLLPAFLGLAGHWINRIGIHRRGSVASSASPRWERWGAHVSKHAWPYAIGVTLLLVGLTAPVLALRLGFPDEGTLPESRTERRAYDLVAEGFGPGINGPLVIAVDISEDASVVEPLVQVVSSDPGVAAVAPPEVDVDAGVATLLAFPTTAPQDDATLDTIERIRADAFPSVLDDSPAVAHVGGQTASFADIGQRVTDRLPMFIVAVIVLSFLLLTVVFRSVLVPLKAALLNLLSIGAAYGVLVMVFQWGWGKGLIGLESTVPIVSFIPMFMFAILFGLSMDYEVFLLSRVREEYLLSGDNDRSVISGIASTARVITSAALIMISVFLGFVLGDDPVIKMMGLGLATAIFVDATIVRVVLVPATMKLMGDANWWIPAWLDRLLPTVDIDGEAGLPEPEYEPLPAPADGGHDGGHDDDPDIDLEPVPALA